MKSTASRFGVRAGVAGALGVAAWLCAAAARGQAPLAPWGEPGPRPENLDPWERPFEFPAAEAGLRDRKAERLAFWRDFLGEPPARLAGPLAEEVAAVLADGCGAEEASSLLARAFPGLEGADGLSFRSSTLGMRPDEGPAAVTMPWAYAYALLVGNSGNLPGALAVWYIVGASGPDESYAWRDLLAAGLAADKYLGWTDNDRWRETAAPRRAVLEPLAAKNTAAGMAALEAESPGRHDRFLYDRLHDSTMGLQEDRTVLWPICAELEALGVANAAACELRAENEIKRAWGFRGGGWASTVTEEGWEGFREHLAASVEWAKRATELDPGWGEPWAVLLTAEGGGGAVGRSELELCREALSRDLGCTYAADQLILFLQPRWNCGAEDALRALRGLVSIPRFDAAVPFRACDALQTLAGDQARFPGPYAALGRRLPLDSDPALWPAFRAMFEGYLACPESPFEPREILREYLASARRVHDPAPALDAWRKAGCPILWPDDPDPARRESLSLGRGGTARLGTEALFDHYAPGALRDLAAAVFLRDRDAAADALQRLREGTAPLRGSAVDKIRVRAERDFAIAFEWEPEDGWRDRYRVAMWSFRQTHHGDAWHTDGASGFCVSATNRPRSPCLWGLRHDDDPATFDLAADFLADPAPAPVGTEPLQPVVALGLHLDKAPVAGVRFDPASGVLEAFVSHPTNRNDRIAFARKEVGPIPRGAWFRLRVAVRDGLLSAWFDGQPAVEAFPVPGFADGDGDDFPFPAGAPLAPVLEVPSLPAGATVWIDRIRSRFEDVPEPGPPPTEELP